MGFKSCEDLPDKTVCRFFLSDYIFENRKKALRGCESENVRFCVCKAQEKEHTNVGDANVPKGFSGIDELPYLSG